MTGKTLFMSCLFLGATLAAAAQQAELYEIQGAKLGRKIARQVKSASREQSNPTLGAQTFIGGDLHKGRGGLTSFVGAMDGAVVGTAAKRYKYQNYYHGATGFNYRKPATQSSDISALDIANITFADDDADGKLGKDETAQVYFDLINTGDAPLYGITPVLMADKTAHLSISSPVPIDTLEAQSAIRYVIELCGDGKKEAPAKSLLLRIRYGDNQYSDVQQIVLGTKKRRD